MGTADEFAKGFGQQSHNDKNESFERSTLKEVLKQLGWTVAAVNTQARELDEGFGWQWFNDECLLKNARVGSTRVFNFNFIELLTKATSRHPLVVSFKEFEGDAFDSCCLVFKVYDHGRWVATNMPITDESHFHVVTSIATFNVLPFPKFFQHRWGDDIP